jgi:hypothetical protein
MFRIQHRLSDWPHCVVELQCCGGSAGLPVQLLIRRRGDITFEALLKRLRCKREHCAGVSGRGASQNGAVWAYGGLGGREVAPRSGTVFGGG